MSEMSGKTVTALARSFFLLASPGQRYCIYFPAAGSVSRGAIVYIAPFAEEMNKSRHMAALQARAFASAGYHVLLLDLYGCGDSSGDFNDSRWSIWQADVLLAVDWLKQISGHHVTLWGLRLGAVLALDVCRDDPALVSLLLWQPVTNCHSFMTQFYRLRVAGDMLAEPEHQLGASTRQIRSHFDKTESVEIAGYFLHPALAKAIEALDVASWDFRDKHIHWLECFSNARSEITSPKQKLAAHWQQAGNHVTLSFVTCPSFWRSQEMVTGPELLTRSSALIVELAGNTQ